MWDEEWVEIAPHKPSIAGGLKGVDDIVYGLTTRGGELWESISYPNWDRFVVERIDNFEGEIIGTTQQMVRQWLPLLHYGTLIPGSEIWDVISPWQATYWKSLPLGHRLKYQNKGDQTGSEVSNHQIERMHRIERLKIREMTKLRKWYHHPFE